MRSVAAILALCAMLGGCASINYIRDEYHGVAIVEVAMPDDTYRVFDKPAEGKLMITSSIASAAGQGFVRGLTLGVAPDPPRPLFEAAAARFLEQSGRQGCRVVDAYLLARPQWEVKYDCTPAATGIPPSRRKPGT